MEAPRRSAKPVPEADPPPVAEGCLRVDTLMGLPEVLSALGLDPGAAIAEAGLDPGIFEDTRNEVPMVGLGRILASGGMRSGCAHLGLLVGQRAGLASLDLFGLLLQHSPDVGTALRNLAGHVRLRDRGAVVTFLASEGVASLGYEILESDVEGSDQICDGALAIGNNILRALCGPVWRPSEVRFAHRAPTDRGPFRRAFDAPLRFDVERTELVFPAEWLGHRTRGADPTLFGELASRVEALESRVEADLLADLHRLLRVMLLTGGASVAELADRLGMHRRTLNRRLAARGTSLHHLIETTRFQLARHLVAHTRMPLIEVAEALGYADASAFTRAFRRWAGRPPSVWRTESPAV